MIARQLLAAATAAALDLEARAHAEPNRAAANRHALCASDLLVAVQTAVSRLDPAVMGTLDGAPQTAERADLEALSSRLVEFVMRRAA